jgi:type I restriction enzyme M protein
MPSFGKTNPLTEAHFKEFEGAFGDDPHGRADRKDEGEEGRFRRFTRDEIAARGDNLDITWLRDAEDDPEDGLTDPEEIVGAIMGHLTEAMAEIEALSEELSPETVAEVAV